MNTWLSFSDSAKYAEAAKNFLLGNGLSIHHSFFNPEIISKFQIGQSFPAGLLPVTSIILACIFKIFGISDTSVFFTGLLFYFLCSVLLFLIARILASTTAGVVSVCLFASSLFFHDYLANFSSEIPFTLEILLITYLFLKIKQPILKWLSVLLVFAVAYFTRQQVTVILLSFVVSVIALQFPGASLDRKKMIILLTLGLITIGAAGLFNSGYSLFSPLHLLGSVQISTQQAPGTILRGEPAVLAGGESLVSKISYNVYNFAKAPDRLANPAVILLFVFFLFIKTSSEKTRFIKLFSAISFILLIIAASATLPNARYIHSILPLIYIGSGIALIETGKMISNKKIFRYALIFCLLLFITLPTIGHYTLDAKALSRTQNVSQPPVYRQIAKVMEENIPKGHLIITNLDAWAAWYTGLTTMWFPIKPEMLNLKNKVEYIVITNYLENDTDFSLGDWKDVVYSPAKIPNKFLDQNYVLLKTFLISPQESRENIEIRGTILRLK